MGRVKARQDAHLALLVCTEWAGVTNVVHGRCAGLRHLKATGLVGAGLRIRDAGQRNRYGSEKYHPDHSTKPGLWERAPPAKGSEATGRIPERLLTSAQTASLGSCGQPLPAGKAGLSLARQAPTIPRFLERSGASDDPGRRKLSPERVCVLPFRDPWRTGRSTGSPQGRVHGVPGRAEHRPATQMEGPSHTPASPDGGAGHYQ